MTSPAAAAAADSILVIPVGSTEQHGPHLPLTTDSDIAVEISRRLASRTGGVVVAPALCYGASGEHSGFPGTLSIGNAATEQVLVELVRSASDTWARILLLSTHGGNDVPVRRAVARARSEGRDVRAWSPSWPGDAHAGHTETSIMLCVAPARVDRAAAEAGARDRLEDIVDVMRAEGVAAVSPNGVLGDPAGADADHGLRLLEAAADELVQIVTAWPRRHA
jgi:mycofactocin precursor peptide peptidase